MGREHDFRNAVERHTDRGGRDGHWEEDDEGVRRKITYAVFDCTHCDEEGVGTKASFDMWDEAWSPVRQHLESEHPEKLSEEDPEVPF